MQELLKDT